MIVTVSMPRLAMSDAISERSGFSVTSTCKNLYSVCTNPYRDRRGEGGLSDPLPVMEVLHDLSVSSAIRGRLDRLWLVHRSLLPYLKRSELQAHQPWSEPRAYNCRNSLARERLALIMKKMPTPYRTLHSPLQTTAETRISSSPLVLLCRRLSGVRSKSL